MIGWEQKIVDAFIAHYFASASETEENRDVLRIRSSVFFPNFNASPPDEKVSYLEAAEALERRGIVKLNWEKRSKGERLKTLSCEDFEKLFQAAGKVYPRTEAETIRIMLAATVKALRESFAADDGVINFLEFYSLHFGPHEIGQGIDLRTMEELARLLEFICKDDVRMTGVSQALTTRALSILLYRDSKQLENLLALCKPLLTRARKTVPVPDIAFLERSYPQTMISGKIKIEFANHSAPLVNADGHILGFPLETAEDIGTIQLLSEKKEKTVLTIENKETFYALGSPRKFSADGIFSRYDCFLYIGGYSNRAAAALIKILSACDFTFYHAGDLDPDGVLILQHIRDIAQKPVIPVRMDAATFDQYRTWGRTLTKPMLRQIAKIREEVKAIPELNGLLQRIEETGLGVEQEIIDYR